MATGILMLLVFRYTSDQKGLRAARQRIGAYLLELRLFKDDPALVVAAQKQVVAAIFVYMKYAAPSFALLLIPLTILVAHLNLLFAYRALRPGESTIVSVTLRERLVWNATAVRLDAPSGMVAETPALRIAEEREVAWRLRATKEGRFALAVHFADQVFRKEVLASDGLVRITPTRRRGGLLARVLAPGEAPLPPDAPIDSIDVRYRPRFFAIFDWQLSWSVLFAVLSLASAYALKSLMRVEI